MARGIDKTKQTQPPSADDGKPRSDKEEISYLRQKFGSLMMRGLYRECAKLIEDNLRLLYFKERWPENFFASLRILRKCYPAMDLNQSFEEYLSALLKRHGIPGVFTTMLRGSDTSIVWSGDYFKDLAIVAEGKGNLAEALDYCELYIKMEPTNSNAFLLKGWILEGCGRGDDAAAAFEQSLELNETNYQAHRSLSKYYTAKNPAKALEHIERAQELAPSDPRIAATKAEILLATGDRAGAITCYDEAIALDPLSAEYPFLKGEILLSEGQTLAAMRQYSIAAGINEKHLPSLGRLADLTAQDQPDLALPYINTVCTLEPENRAAALLRANLLRRTGDTGMAIRQFAAVLELDPACAEAYAGLGDLYLPEDPARALQNYNKAIDIDDRDAATRLGKAKALSKLEDYQQAAREYEAAAMLDRRCAEAWGALGMLYADSKPAAAVEYLSKAVALVPDNPDYHQARGRALLRLPNRLEEAIAAYDNAARYDPGNAEYQLKLAQLLEQVGNTASALEHYRFAASLNNASAPAYYGLAKLMQDTQPDVAITHINSAIGLDTTNGEYYYLKARILDNLGRRDDSLFNLKKSLYGDHQNAATMQELSQVLSGESPRVALMYINRAIELSPDNSLYVCTRANILYNVGSMGKALAQYEAALKLDADNHEALFGIGRVLAAKGDKKALEYFDKALARAPAVPQYHAARAAVLGWSAETCKQALAAYDKAIALDNRRWDIILAKAKLLDASGDLAGAQAEYRRVLLVNRDSLDAAARMGELLSERGVAAGLSYLDHAIELAPENSYYHVLRARLLFTLGRGVEAEDACRMALSLGGGSPELRAEVCATLARVLYEKLPETALKYITEAVELAPGDAAGHALRGDIHRLLGEQDAAKACYSRALELDGRLAAALSSLAEIYYDENNPACLDMIEKAVALEPQNTGYLHTKARILHELEHDLPGAIACMDAALGGDPQNIPCRELLVELLTQNKNRIRALLERRKLEKARRRIQDMERSLYAADELCPAPEPESVPVMPLEETDRAAGLSQS